MSNVINSPVEEIFGLMGDVKKSKKSSVELQHEIGRILSKKYAKKK